jgi:hypothetical protein
MLADELASLVTKQGFLACVAQLPKFLLQERGCLSQHIAALTVAIVVLQCKVAGRFLHLIAEGIAGHRSNGLYEDSAITSTSWIALP